MLLRDGSRFRVDRADLDDHFEVRGAVDQREKLGSLRRSADAGFHLRLLENELYGVRSESVVDRAQREVVGVTTLLGQNPFHTVFAINSKNFILQVSGTLGDVLRLFQALGHSGEALKRSSGSFPRLRCRCTTCSQVHSHSHPAGDGKRIELRKVCIHSTVHRDSVAFHA